MLLHFADLHLDKGRAGDIGNSGFPKRVEDVITHLGQITDAIVEHDVRCVLFAGDAYLNYSPTQRYRAVVQRTFRQWADMGVVIYGITGNHDISSRAGTPHALAEFLTLPHENITILSEPCTIDTPFGFRLVALPWSTTLRIPAWLDSVGGLSNDDIVLGHVNVSDFISSIGMDAHNEPMVCTVADLSASKYAALGHIHHPFEQDGVVYPGSVGIQDWGEFTNPPHFFTIVNRVTGDYQRIKYNELREMREFRFNAPECEADVLSGIPMELDLEGMYRLVVEDANFSMTNAIRARFNGTTDFTCSWSVRSRHVRGKAFARINTNNYAEIMRSYYEHNGYGRVPDEFEDIVLECGGHI